VSELFERAAQATHAVDQHCGRAAALLDHPRVQGSAGELLDPRGVHDSLLAVRQEVDVALSLLTKTTWPMPGDYEALRTARRGR
jgi:hypothetical protein